MQARTTFALFSALDLLVISSVLNAEPKAPATAETAVGSEATTLFEEGRRLKAEGKLSDACAKFEQSLALAAGVGTKFNLADCFEEIGKTHSAHALFLEVAETTRALGQAKRESAARARLAALETRLSRITIQAEPRPELSLMLDGKPLDAARASAPFAVDPGKHAISASETGKRGWTVELDVPAGPTNVVVVIPKLEPEPKRQVAAKPKPLRAAAAPVGTQRERPADASGSSRSTLALILGGAGVAGLAGGGYMGFRYLESQDEAKTTCPSGENCTITEIEQHRAAVDDAKTARIWSFVGVGVGTAALGVAAYLYFTDEGNDGEGRVVAAPLIGDGTFGATASLSF
jgi:hypothetical protein